MSSRSLVDEIFEWDVHNWSKALPLWDERLPEPRSRALTLGERNGGLSLWCALRGLSVDATDLNGLTDEARALHDRYEVGGSITYGSADVTSLPYETETFDVVAFKSVLGALETKPRQRQAMSEIARVLKPGGVLCFAENLAVSGLHQRMRSRFVPWSKSWRYIEYGRDRDLFDDFDIESEHYGGFLATLGRTEDQRGLLGRLDDRLMPIVPERMRYIVFGVARKPL